MLPGNDPAYTHFDENGVLKAVKLARITASRGLPIVAATNDNEVSVAAITHGVDPLATGETQKIIRVSKHCLALVTGHGGDVNRVRTMLNDIAINHKHVYGSEISPKEVSSQISRSFHDLGMRHMRPFGIGLILAGFDHAGTKPVTYIADVDGNEIPRKGAALGRSASVAENVLRKELNGRKKLETVVKAAAKAAQQDIAEATNDVELDDLTIEVVTLSK